MTFLEVKNLQKFFPSETLFSSAEPVRALQGVSFSLTQGQTLGLVGESGCGKSTLGRCLMRLLEPTGGEIHFLGKNITHLKGRELRDLRKHIQMVFQDPMGSLNPKMTVQALVEEPLIIHELELDKEQRKKRILQLLDLVGLQSSHLNRYPHEFSGGQRQRIGIARALAAGPQLLICDEPVSALDVSIQAQILKLFKDLRKELGLSYIFISHDLRVVEEICHEVAVMYLGKIVEQAKVDQLYRKPLHPYTQALFSSVPSLNPDEGFSLNPISGELPSPRNPPSGCHFHPRCPKAVEACRETYPAFEEKEPAHWTSCHRVTND